MLQTKLFLLLQSEQYSAALDLIDSLTDPATRAYEKAYAFYRLHRENEAIELLPRLKALQVSDALYKRGVLHLEAQLVRRGSMPSLTSPDVPI